jgi:hypothetical protein
MAIKVTETQIPQVHMNKGIFISSIECKILWIRK